MTIKRIAPEPATEVPSKKPRKISSPVYRAKRKLSIDTSDELDAFLILKGLFKGEMKHEQITALYWEILQQIPALFGTSEIDLPRKTFTFRLSFSDSESLKISIKTIQTIFAKNGISHDLSQGYRFFPLYSRR